MKSNELRITIEGLAGTGKSGVAHAVEEFLKACGLDVSYEDPDTVNTTERTNKVLTSLVHYGAKITIVHQQGRHD